jgi:hypothetical protein
MPMEDGFNPDHPLPLFLADRPERQSIGKVFDRAVISSRVFKASILIAAATATGIVVLSVGGHPGTLFADLTSSLPGNSALRPDTDQPKSTNQSTADAPALIQSTADAQALPPIAKDAPPGDEIAASEPAGKDQAEQSEPSSEVLFRQFQAWVAEQGAPAQVAQNAPARFAENASVPHRLMQKHRALPIRDARAQTRTQNFRNKAQRTQSRLERPPTQGARVERPPVQDARAQSEPVQDPEVGAAAVSAAAYGAYDYYGGYNNDCYRDGYGRWICQQY